MRVFMVAIIKLGDVVTIFVIDSKAMLFCLWN